MKRDADDLIETGNRNIDNILDVKADDYRDKGLSEDEISERLEQDRISEQEEFLHDAFPNQSVSTDVFRSDEQSMDNASDDTVSRQLFALAIIEMEKSNNALSLENLYGYICLIALQRHLHLFYLKQPAETGTEL